MRYDKEYYMSHCGGCEEYIKSQGKEINDVLKYTISLADLKQGDHVLDIGCGRGELVYHTALKGCKVLGIDLSQDAVEIAKQTISKLPEELKHNVRLMQMDACDKKLDNERFDKIFLTDVVEHLNDEELNTVFESCNKILKENGKVIIHTAPTMNYIKIGQQVRRIFYSFKFQTFQTTTLEDEKNKKGHVNIQTKTSLEKYLSKFPKVDCWYQFCVTKNPIKSLIDKIGLAEYLALNLFAIACKKE